jgi:zinc transport system ATP-binding protein
MSCLVEIKELYFSYPGNSVLSNINLNVNRGEFIAIIGPNGGGKTTLLKLILGLLKPASGKIDLFGHPKISYVPQAMRFDKQFPISVLEVVLGGVLSKLPWYGRFHQAEIDAALAALDLVGLAGFEERPFGMLSGGQAQRVLIARALVSQPELLLLDEPTASVDSQAEAEIYALLKKLKGQMTILMITHDLRAAIDNVERVFCVQGTLIALKPEEVCQHFAIGLYHPPLVTFKEA